MLEVHENMTCEERVRFWKESSRFWSRECNRLTKYIDGLMEEGDE